MNMLSAPSPNNIPLHCNICPKRPDFSDVSHLLTHIASKGHLSNYFKAKVKGTRDPAAQQLVAEYDEWYEEWNVDDLMRERMNQKEKKKGGLNNNNSNRSRRATRDTALPVSSRGTPAPNRPTKRPNRLRDSVLDPQLDRRIKEEPLSRSATPGIAFPLDPGSLHRAYAPPMQSLPRTPFDFADTFMKQESVDSSFSDVESVEAFVRPNRRLQPQRHRRQPSDSVASIAEDELEIDETITDHNKLKGVYWPGMAMFDSATPEMRRKRNQKKNVSVVQQLQATSEIVTPTECVFDETGTLRKQRTITGSPESSDSRIEGESSPEPEIIEKKRVPRPRPRSALGDKDANSNRPVRHRGEHRRSLQNRNNGPYYVGPEDDDDDLTYGMSRPKRRRTGLSIHRDNSGPDITFDHPAPFNYLTASFRNPFQGTVQTNPLQPQQRRLPTDHVSQGHRRQPSWGSFGTSFRPTSLMHGLPNTHNFASFGQYISQSMGQPGTHLTTAPGLQAYPSYDHHFGLAPQQFQTDNSMFQQQSNSAWDTFGFGHQELSLSNPADTASPTNDLASNNPLFFSSNQGGPEDDEVTVSATSEH